MNFDLFHFLVSLCVILMALAGVMGFYAFTLWSAARKVNAVRARRNVYRSRR